MNGERRRTDILIGILLVAAAAALILNKLGHFGKIRVFPVLLSILLVKFFWEGIVRRDIGKILFSLAFFIIVNDELLHLEAITPWTVLGAAALGTMGAQLLFPRFGQKRIGDAFSNGQWEGGSKRSLTGREFLFYKNAFGSTVKYIAGEINRVDLRNSFGGLEVFFADAVPKNGEAFVNVESSFGSVELYVPGEWKVVQRIDTAFAGIDESGACDLDGTCVLYIEGRVAFGSLGIQYI